MLVWVYVLNPLTSMLSLYLPGGNAVMTYRPASSAVTVCGTLRSDSVIVTLAPATTPPLTSVTTPRTAAVYDDCAQATPATPSATHSKEIARRRFRTFLIAPPDTVWRLRELSLNGISDFETFVALGSASPDHPPSGRGPRLLGACIPSPHRSDIAHAALWTVPGRCINKNRWSLMTQARPVA